MESPHPIVLTLSSICPQVAIIMFLLWMYSYTKRELEIGVC